MHTFLLQTTLRSAKLDPAGVFKWAFPISPTGKDLIAPANH